MYWFQHMSTPNNSAVSLYIIAPAQLMRGSSTVCVRSITKSSNSTIKADLSRLLPSYDDHGLLSDQNYMVTKNCIMRGGGFIVFIRALICIVHSHSSGYKQKTIILGLK